jgi:hypothetical protein
VNFSAEKTKPKEVIALNAFNDVDILQRRIAPAAITDLSTEEIWERLVTPMTKEIVGNILSVKSQVMQTIEGLFPGDEMHNLNNHMLFGGQIGFVRHPYVHTFCRTEYGAFIVKRDYNKVEAFCWHGDVLKGKGKLVFKVGFRDNRFDGTVYANDTSLLDFPYDDARYSPVLGAEVKTVELSVYSFQPGHSGSTSSSLLMPKTETDFQSFMMNPFRFLDRPHQYKTLFRRAWTTGRAPGQVTLPIEDFSHLVLTTCHEFVASRGYDAVLMATSHYHVCRWGMRNGYEIVEPDVAKTVGELTDGLEKIRKSGKHLTRAQESWVCAVQSLRRKDIPRGLNLGGPTWPQDNITQKSLWMANPLNNCGALTLKRAQSGEFLAQRAEIAKNHRQHKR